MTEQKTTDPVCTCQDEGSPRLKAMGIHTANCAITKARGVLLRERWEKGGEE